MRFGEKGMSAQSGENQLFGVDFHDFIQREQNSNMIELASEFGLSLKDVRKLKKSWNDHNMFLVLTLMKMLRIII
ncbi:hypothetical protein M5V91_27880 [Cytobacillus pseudoceanisediminis]|uniref:hypothetical protein n=1 Tax=Cytobacillus pseudoceanisediminis TaxID=3051614 RepID=UPI0021863C07|nr:hypothetical protein [Cytobacillus pseudoceanisediminis]UQX56874.1 hypothetical protein M5V91_27880 [Cytobacillus pseudoceanisediminis]